MALNVVDDRTRLALSNQLELLCFRVLPDGTQFAINVFKVREAVKFRTLTELPESNPCIIGLLTLRREIIPVVDLRHWLYMGGLRPKGYEEGFDGVDINESQIIICEFNNATIGLWVYKADYILRRNWEHIHVPVSSEFGNKTNNYTKNDKGDIVYIVDVEAMLAELFPMIAQGKAREAEGIDELDLRDELVLIAEDSRSALKALTQVLDRFNVRYHAFDNGRKLLDHIKSHGLGGVGLIITDLEMPETSGFTVIRELKGSGATAKIPIVVNSSMTGNSNQEMAKELNADGFIGKTNPKEIAAYLQQFLGNESA
jgi:two-component system chemotaxis response regulator CheV